MDLNVDLINIVRPKRDADHVGGNSFVGRIAYGPAQSSEVVRMRLHGARILHAKPTARRDESVLLVRCRDAVASVYDVQQRILDIVRAKAHVWFETAMTPDLIEDYFTDMIVTHRTYGGHVIRLKCYDLPDDRLASMMDRPLDIDVAFRQIRFWRQKVAVECTIDDVVDAEPAFGFRDTDEGSDLEEVDDEESASPFLDDAQGLRRECIDALDRRLEELRAQCTALQKDIADLEQQRATADERSLDELYALSMPPASERQE